MAQFKLLALLLLLAVVFAQDDQVTTNGVDNVTTGSGDALAPVQPTAVPKSADEEENVDSETAVAELSTPAKPADAPAPTTDELTNDSEVQADTADESVAEEAPLDDEEEVAPEDDIPDDLDSIDYDAAQQQAVAQEVEAEKKRKPVSSGSRLTLLLGAQSYPASCQRYDNLHKVELGPMRRH